MSADSFTLPPLRSDIRIHPAPDDRSGAPAWTLFDPLTGRYKRLGWSEATLLSHWRAGLTPAQLLEAVHRYTTLRSDLAEVTAFVREVLQSGLTVTLRQDPDALHEAWKRRQPGWWSWLTGRYLFIRIPLLRPDGILETLLPLARLLTSAPLLALYATLTALGLFLLPARVESYLHAFPGFFNLPGVIAYGVTIAAVKLLHEFAHALTARHYGARVRSMGVVLLVFWPVPYSDVTDAWKLPTRRQRFAVGAAGIAAETVLAGVALFVWCIAPPGLLKDLCFLVSSVTLVGTWLVNLNPAMRFDGYYLLMDAWGVDNLQARAFALTKWWLRRALLGLDAPAPENVPPRRLAGFAVYSVYAWLYRLTLYVAIALLLYHMFDKLLGTILLALQVYTFFVATFVQETRMLYRQRDRLRLNPRLLLTLALLLGLGLWLVLPLPRVMTLPAVVVPQAEQIVYSPFDGTLDTALARRGAGVERGDLLARVTSRELEAERFRLQEQASLLEHRREAALADPRRGEALSEILDDLARARAELRALETHLASGDVRASLAGTVLEWREDLADGQAVAAGLVLGRVADPGRPSLQAFLPERLLDALDPEAPVYFIPANGAKRIPCTVTRIGRDRLLSIDYPAVTSVTGGDIHVVPESDGTLVPQETAFRMELQFSGKPSTNLYASGHVTARTRPRSRALDLLRYAWNVLLRESGF